MRLPLLFAFVAQGQTQKRFSAVALLFSSATASGASVIFFKNGDRPMSCRFSGPPLVLFCHGVTSGAARVAGLSARFFCLLFSHPTFRRPKQPFLFVLAAFAVALVVPDVNASAVPEFWLSGFPEFEGHPVSGHYTLSTSMSFGGDVGMDIYNLQPVAPGSSLVQNMRFSASADDAWVSVGSMYSTILSGAGLSAILSGHGEWHAQNGYSYTGGGVVSLSDPTLSPPSNSEGDAFGFAAVLAKSSDIFEASRYLILSLLSMGVAVFISRKILVK